MPAPQEAHVRERQDRDLNACEGRLSFMEGPTGVYEYARQAGSPRVYWQTHETNAVAMQLYDKVVERSGFFVYRKTT